MLKAKGSDKIIHEEFLMSWEKTGTLEKRDQLLKQIIRHNRLLGDIIETESGEKAGR